MPVIGCYLAQGVLSLVDCTRIYSFRPNRLVGFPVSYRYASLDVTLRGFYRGVTKSVVLNP